MKSTTRPNTNTHFCFLIRDPSNHIESISENRQIVETTKSEGADYAYYVTVPKQDQYFPILKYECSGNLRPVPIVSTGDLTIFESIIELFLFAGKIVFFVSAFKPRSKPRGSTVVLPCRFLPIP